jgi:hypothetical protein
LASRPTTSVPGSRGAPPPHPAARNAAQAKARATPRRTDFKHMRGLYQPPLMPLRNELHGIRQNFAIGYSGQFHTPASEYL